MNYSDKLNYLFELTRAEGKELATAMSVTPPQISKMRNGTRGLPRDKDSARRLAQFFAQRCGSEQQRDALAKTLRIAQIRSIDSERVLTDVLLNWLSDEQDSSGHAARRADDFLQQFGTDTVRRPVKASAPIDDAVHATLTTNEGSAIAYYGSEGRRWAVLSFMHYVERQRQAYTVNVLTDENMDWVLEDPAFSGHLQDSMLRLTEHGCTFRRVVAPITDIDQAFESLNRWLPLYMKGMAASYYYKRMRDNLNRITLFVVPDVAVLFSFSVGGVAQGNGVTFFTTDERTVNSLMVEFENYISMCEPIMRVFDASSPFPALLECLLEYEDCKADSIQRCNSLSTITMPWNVAMQLRATEQPERKSQFLTAFAQRYKKFKQNLEHYSYTDIIRLAELTDIMDGAVSIPAACVISSDIQYYTPDAYLQHLRSILYLIKHQPHYHAVLLDSALPDQTVVYVKEGFRALLTLEAYPPKAFAVSERYLVDAFAEYLHRTLPPDPDESFVRRNVALRIQTLIEQLEEQLRKPRD